MYLIYFLNIHVANETPPTAENNDDDNGGGGDNGNAISIMNYISTR